MPFLLVQAGHKKMQTKQNYMFFLEAGCKIKKKEEEAWVCEKK